VKINWASADANVLLSLPKLGISRRKRAAEFALTRDHKCFEYERGR